MGALPAMHVSAGCTDFINEARFNALLAAGRPDAGRVREIIDKSLAKQALSVEETAVLLGAEDRGQIEAIFQAARTLKERVYGNRIVLFAPLYVGNHCVNDCAYCGFKRSNKDAVRRTLGGEELGWLWPITGREGLPTPCARSRKPWPSDGRLRNSRRLARSSNRSL